jgi:transposase-like protein
VARTHARKDWAALKAAYRRGEGSVAKLARKHGIAKSTAEKRCAREKWQVERQEVGRRAEAKAVERDVESVATMLGKHRGLANLALRLAARRLEQLDELSAKDAKAVSAEALDDLTKIVARMVPVERLAAGIERIKPVKPVEMADDDEIVFEVDAPPENEQQEAPAIAPAKAS